MEISLSTIKKGKVYGVLPCDTNIVSYMSRKQFVASVKTWALSYYRTTLSVFTAVEEDLYSVIIILDINDDHEEFQQTIDISIVESE